MDLAGGEWSLSARLAANRVRDTLKIIPPPKPSRFDSSEKRMQREPLHRRSRVVQPRQVDRRPAGERQIVADRVDDFQPQAGPSDPGLGAENVREVVDRLPTLGVT